MKALLHAIMGALILSAVASAEVPRRFSYQGILTDDIGVPIADGDYSLTVRLYDAETDGTLLYAETHAAVPVVSGGFNVLIGSFTPLTLGFDQPLWLSLQVGTDPELAPRTELASSPYALGLSLPFDGTASGPAYAFTVRNPSGPAILSDGWLHVRNGGSTPIVTVDPFGGVGGSVVTRDETGGATVRLEPDGNGTGGFLAVYRSVTNIGFTVNGNDGNQEPIVSINGSVRSAIFNMGASGDDAVLLPGSSISSGEMANEAGVAQIFSNASLAVTTSIAPVTSRTIATPADGYVIAIAGGWASLSHVSGADSRVVFGVNDVSDAFASSTGNTGVPSSAPTGTYRSSTAWSGVWPVTAGTHTFFFLAQRVGAASGANINDPTLTLIYVPTAYGAVTGNRLFGDGVAETGPLTHGQIEAEQAEAAAFDAARLSREIEQLRAQVESLNQRLADDPNSAVTVGR